MPVRLALLLGGAIAALAAADPRGAVTAVPVAIGGLVTVVEPSFVAHGWEVSTGIWRTL